MHFLLDVYHDIRYHVSGICKKVNWNEHFRPLPCTPPHILLKTLSFLLGIKNAFLRSGCLIVLNVSCKSIDYIIKHTMTSNEWNCIMQPTDQLVLIISCMLSKSMQRITRFLFLFSTVWIFLKLYSWYMYML